MQHLGVLAGSTDVIFADATLMQALKSWFETHKYHIELPNGKKGLVTTQGMSAQGDEAPSESFIYYDDIIKTVFSFNPQTLVGTIQSEEGLAVQTCAFRDSLIAETNKYIDINYRKGTALYAVTQGADEGH